MRLAVIALALVVAFGCKDKKAEDQPAQLKEFGEKQKPDQRPELVSPNVKGPGVETVKTLAAKLTYSTTAVEVDGVVIAEVDADGVLDQERYDKLISALEAKVASDDPVGLALHANLPYLRINHLVGRLKTAGFRNLALLSGDGSLMVPLEMRDGKDRGGTVQPVVTVRDGHVILWSKSGDEGTRTKPKLDHVYVKDRSFKPLTEALAELVQRRWPNGTRPPDDFTIVLDVERNATAETLIQVAAAVRAHGKLQLFPKVSLLGGL